MNITEDMLSIHQQQGLEEIDCFSRYLSVDPEALKPHIAWLAALAGLGEVLIEVAYDRPLEVRQTPAQVARAVAYIVTKVSESLGRCFKSRDPQLILANLNALSYEMVPRATMMGSKLGFLPVATIPMNIPKFLEAVKSSAWAEVGIDIMEPGADSSLGATGGLTVTGMIDFRASMGLPALDDVDRRTLKEKAKSEGVVLINPQPPQVLPYGTAHVGTELRPQHTVGYVPMKSTIPGDFFGAQEESEMLKADKTRVEFAGVSKELGNSDRTGLITPHIVHKEISAEEHARSLQSINLYNPPDYHKFTAKIARVPTPDTEEVKAGKALRLRNAKLHPEMLEEIEREDDEDKRLRETHNHIRGSGGHGHSGGGGGESPEGGEGRGRERGNLYLHRPMNPHSHCQQHTTMLDAMSPDKLMANSKVQSLQGDKASKEGNPGSGSRGEKKKRPSTPKLDQLHWPLKTDTLWSAEIMSEYVHKSHTQMQRADLAFGSAASTFPVARGPRKRDSLLKLAAGPVELPLPAHITRIHEVETRIKEKQAPTLTHDP